MFHLLNLILENSAHVCNTPHYCHPNSLTFLLNSPPAHKSLVHISVYSFYSVATEINRANYLAMGLELITYYICS